MAPADHAADLAARIAARAGAYGCDVDARLASSLAAYLELLARWNERLNLTALPLRPVSDAAVDRLIVEPLIAAGVIGDSVKHVTDVGSGSGSPAIPMKLARPTAGLTMVEARARKSAFLRETVRVLGLRNARVETRQMGVFGRTTESVQADVVTVRAVPLDSAIVGEIRGILGASGRLLWFTSGDDVDAALRSWESVSMHPLPRGLLRVLRPPQ